MASVLFLLAQSLEQGFVSEQPDSCQLGLDLAAISLGSEGAARLSSTLRELLGANTTLTGLDVRDNGIGDLGANALALAAATLPNLLSFDVGGANNVGADSFITLLGLAFHPTLTSLRLPAPPFASCTRKLAGQRGHVTQPSTACGMQLQRTTKSHKPEWMPRHTKQATRLLARLATSSLRELRIPNWAVLGESALVALAGALSQGAHLALVDLRSARISAHTAASFADALASRTCTLTSLQLASNGLSVHSVSRIAHALRNNTSLRRLGLDGNAVGAIGARELIKSTRMSGTMLVISMANAGVGMRRQVELQRHLATNLETYHSLRTHTGLSRALK